jgi:hypothetical protein
VLGQKYFLGLPAPSLQQRLSQSLDQGILLVRENGPHIEHQLAVAQATRASAHFRQSG